MTLTRGQRSNIVRRWNYRRQEPADIAADIGADIAEVLEFLRWRPGYPGKIISIYRPTTSNAEIGKIWRAKKKRERASA